ncbi:NAD-dependent succinate-semialdehyde dehydrogenase [Ornithinimicrobium murale]|uniref:NAD-dependent succinate-semialdehyde dehydrogenase n=1 Tax=Ornithinimicrobium murale TaxID=1050153 RepID=UPI000E0CFE03|nr:NAD-dependent succinate-semialdehyde dehydrogenase [Ornithinimicrobium murale]
MITTQQNQEHFTGSFINGCWVQSTEGATQSVVDPADGSVIAEVADTSAEQCIEAVEAARDAFPSWSATPPRARAEILRTAFTLMTEERDTIARLIVRENGKVLADALGEVDYAAEFFRWFSEEAVRVEGDFRVAPGGDKRIIVTHQPIGVAVLVTPWNFPAAMATRKIGPALAAGCSVVLKPATETPLTATYLMDLLKRAGVPAGVVNCVTPADPGPAVSAMLHHPAVRKLSFTGSTEVGRALLHEAADQVVSTSMELGGNAPFLVLDDADVDEAVEGALVAKLRNGGAACTAANRFYVHRSLAEAFTRQLAERMGQLGAGPGDDPANEVGAMVSEAECQKIARLVDHAVTEGATVLTGGSRLERAGAFYPPTVLADVHHGHDIIRQEVFGPVAPVTVFDRDDEAIDWANDTDMGLIAYVYSSSLSRAVRTAERIETGMVAINRGVASDPAAPFGGMKQSGLGREGGDAGILEFLEPKYLAVPL